MRGRNKDTAMKIFDEGGIASPSKLFRDEIGANLALGIGEGFSDEMKNVQRQMEAQKERRRRRR